MKTTLLKDGHVFVLHILEPMDPQDDAELSELLSGPLEKPTAESTPDKTGSDESAKTTEPGNLDKQGLYFTF